MLWFSNQWNEIVFSVLAWFTFSAGRSKFLYLVNQFPFKRTGKPGCSLRDTSRPCADVGQRQGKKCLSTITAGILARSLANCYYYFFLFIFFYLHCALKFTITVHHYRQTIKNNNKKKPHKKAFKITYRKKERKKKKTSKRKRIQEPHVNISPLHNV